MQNHAVTDNVDFLPKSIYHPAIIFSLDPDMMSSFILNFAMKGTVNDRVANKRNQ